MVQKMKYMMAACFLMVATTCMAMLQQKPGDGEQPRDGKRPRPNMEQFVKSQATRIAQSLKLDGETSKKFIQTFYNCRKEMAATMKRYPHTRQKDARYSRKVLCRLLQVPHAKADSASI